ncbi:MAG: class II aldolase/adducin family protein [Actinobacteria bacterium]|nr:class II aldolase/adducin family protein [Actinomycetota bacterium]MBM3713047.1 class II aldolase/adducin family protein [Actinomycetota bacterium]
MVDVKNIRKSICQMAKHLYDKNIADSSGGNISVRDGNLIYITQRRSGEVYQWLIEEDSILVTDICGNPVIGSVENITREATTHYYIYQNFSDIKAIIHCHPLYMMVFGAAHMEIPAVSECTRDHLGDQPITCTPEVEPGSENQAIEVVKEFKKRRAIDPEAGLIVNIPYHGVFIAGRDLNSTFIAIEAAENAAKIIIYRKLMFHDDPRADFSIHQKLSRGYLEKLEEQKQYCKIGQEYSDAFGKKRIYDGKCPYISKKF